MKSSIKTIIKKLPFSLGVQLLNSDSSTSLFALNKPEGIKSHPNRPGIDKNALIHAPYDLENECYLCDIPDGQKIKVHLLNRLDSPTSGVILLCLNSELALEIRSLFKNHKIQKTYFAAVRGIPRVRYATWRNSLSSKKQEEKVRTQKGGARIAETKFQFIAQNKLLDVALLKLSPITGFTHQLRVQGALHKHPILGDKTYGDFTFNKDIHKKTALKRLFLHSFEIFLTYNYLGKEYTFKAHAEMPKEFDDLMQFGVSSLR